VGFWNNGDRRLEEERAFEMPVKSVPTTKCQSGRFSISPSKSRVEGGFLSWWLLASLLAWRRLIGSLQNPIFRGGGLRREVHLQATQFGQWARPRQAELGVVRTCHRLKSAKSLGALCLADPGPNLIRRLQNPVPTIVAPRLQSRPVAASPDSPIPRPNPALRRH
jgi:hypothetical protein